MWVAATDWEAVTAIATAALAFLTFVLAGAAIVAALFAKRAIDADREAAREAHRPLLLDVAETTSAESDLDPGPTATLSFSGVHTVEWDWRLVYVGLADGLLYVAVPLRNVGNGPAVIAVDGIRVVDDGVDRLPAAAEVHRERVAPGETTRVLCSYRSTREESLRSLTLMVPYRDFTGDQKTAASVELERVRDDHWRINAITPVESRN
jgi:hypothetical protein